MAAKRTHDEKNEHVIAWVAAGTAVGLVVGALVAERLSGRELTFRSLYDRGRALMTRASSRWEPLVDAAIGVRDAWEGAGEEPDETEDVEARDEESDLDDEALDDEDLEDDELDDDLEDDELDDEELDDEDLDDDDLDEDEEFGDEEDGESEGETETESAADDESTALDARVLEAFVNDPVLVERDVEIEAMENAEIVLHGRVHTAREVAHAVTIARGVPGVAAVHQQLTVRDRR